MQERHTDITEIKHLINGYFMASLTDSEERKLRDIATAFASEPTAYGFITDTEISDSLLMISAMAGASEADIMPKELLETLDNQIARLDCKSRRHRRLSIWSAAAAVAAIATVSTYLMQSNTETCVTPDRSDMMAKAITSSPVKADTMSAPAGMTCRMPGSITTSAKETMQNTRRGIASVSKTYEEQADTAKATVQPEFTYIEENTVAAESVDATAIAMCESMKMIDQSLTSVANAFRLTETVLAQVDNNFTNHNNEIIKVIY